MFEQNNIAVRLSAAGLFVAKFTFLTVLTMVAFTILKLGDFSIASSQTRAPVRLTRLARTKPDETVAPSVYDVENAMNATDLVERWAPFIAEASLRFGVPQSWIRAVIRQESGGRTVSEGDIPITSNAGAEGLMQVMPDTYDEMKAQYALGNDAYDPHDNIIAGTAYLRWLYGRYGFPDMFAAYNDGPGNFDKYLLKGRALPAETVAYLANLTATLGNSRHARA